MKKKILVGCICLCLCLSACTSYNKKEINIQDLAQEFAKSSAFEETLTMQADESAKKIARLTDFEIDEIILYVDSGALSDKILLIKADEAVLEEIKEYLMKENKSLQESYSSYNPEEVPKLENAFLKVINNTLIYCVSEHSEVIESVLDFYMSEK